MTIERSRPAWVGDNRSGLELRLCAACATPFQPRHVRHRCCSMPCQLHAEALRRRRTGGPGKGWAKGRQQGEDNPIWKGDRATYKAFHVRVNAARGKAEGCSRCGASGFCEWANLTGNYADVADYASMCRPCHRRFDFDRSGRVLGVRERRGKFAAHVTVLGKQKHLGTFDTREEAEAVAVAARAEVSRGGRW